MRVFHSAAHVAIGDEPLHYAICGGDDAQSQTAAADVDDGFSHFHVGGDDGQVVGAHDVAGFGQQAFAQSAAGMEAGKVGRLESAGFDESAGQGIAQRQLRRGR